MLISIKLLHAGREFDENLMQRVSQIYYENEILDLPYSPDVRDYLMTVVRAPSQLLNTIMIVIVFIMGELMDYQDTGLVPSSKRDAPISEGIPGAEVEERLNQAVGSLFISFFLFSWCFSGSELAAPFRGKPWDRLMSITSIFQELAMVPNI